MSKVFLAIVVSIFTSIGSSFALANEGWYAGVSVGSSEVDDACTGVPAGVSCDDSDTGFKLFVGNQSTKNWGSEFGFVDLGEATASGTPFGIPSTAKIEADGFFLAGTGTVPLGQEEKFALFGKLGVIRWDVTASATGLVSGSVSEDGFSPMFGIGLKYDFTERVGIRAEWERFLDLGDSATTGEADVDLITIGVVVWFGAKSANAGSGTPTSSGKLTPSPAPATTTALAPTTIAIDAPATRPDKERELLRSIAGKWSGDGISTRGTPYSITYIFKEDGSFDVSWRWGTNADRGQYPPGTLRVIGSHFEHKNPDGRLWTITLHKDKKGQRILKGRRQDGNKWELKEQK